MENKDYGTYIASWVRRRGAINSNELIAALMFHYDICAENATKIFNEWLKEQA